MSRLVLDPFSLLCVPQVLSWEDTLYSGYFMHQLNITL